MDFLQWGKVVKMWTGTKTTPCLVTDVHCQLPFIHCFENIFTWVLFYIKHHSCRHDKSVQKEFMFKIEQVKIFIINAKRPMSSMYREWRKSRRGGWSVSPKGRTSRRLKRRGTVHKKQREMGSYWDIMGDSTPATLLTKKRSHILREVLPSVGGYLITLWTLNLHLH